MKRLLVVLNIAVALGVAFLLMTPSRGLAQDTGAVKPSPDQAGPSAKQEPPPGGCMPIGVTASGEIVFPFLCKGFIDRHKAADQPPAPAEQSQKSPVAAGEPRPSSDAERKASDLTPATDQSREKPVTAQGVRPASDAVTGSTDDKSSVKPPENAPPEIARPMLQQVETAPPQGTERDKPRESKRRREDRAGPSGCTHFRSYDRESGTYTDYSGRRRDCHA